MKVSKNFSAQEILPKHWWLTHGPSGLRVMDKRIIDANQAVRDRQGKGRKVNDWASGGNRNQSGLRVPGMSHYNLLSMHSWGKALDSISNTIPHEELWEDIITNPDDFWEMGFTCIESINRAPTWLHGDCRTFDYIGDPIEELQIIEKVEGVWRNFSVDEWKANFG